MAPALSWTIEVWMPGATWVVYFPNGQAAHQQGCMILHAEVWSFLNAMLFAITPLHRSNCIQQKIEVSKMLVPAE
jgi:hypothetical protein